MTTGTGRGMETGQVASAESAIPEEAQGSEKAVIKTAGRVFAVLEYMRKQRRAVTVREIADTLGYPKSSTLVLMKSIAALGYLRYDLQQRAFFATTRLAQLGDWVLESDDQGGRWLDVVHKVAAATHETGILAVENDIYAQYVHVILSGRPIAFNVQPGTRRLLAMSGLGWALLSRRSDSEVERVVHRTNVRLHRGGQKVDLETVLANVRKARAAGYACSFNTVTEGIGIIAMPLPAGAESDERLAIGVGGFVSRIERASDSIIACMRQEIARGLQAPAGAAETAAPLEP